MESLQTSPPTQNLNRVLGFRGVGLRAPNPQNLRQHQGTDLRCRAKALALRLSWRNAGGWGFQALKGEGLRVEGLWFRV